MISAALDAACGYAAYTIIDPEASILTIEFKVNLLSPGVATVSCFVRDYQTRLHHHRCGWPRYALSNGPAKLIASMSGSMMVIRGRRM